jgi:hypothetical protein
MHAVLCRCIPPGTPGTNSTTPGHTAAHRRSASTGPARRAAPRPRQGHGRSMPWASVRAHGQRRPCGSASGPAPSASSARGTPPGPAIVEHAMPSTAPPSPRPAASSATATAPVSVRPAAQVRGRGAGMLRLDVFDCATERNVTTAGASTGARQCPDVSFWGDSPPMGRTRWPSCTQSCRRKSNRL